ncbi:MAG TPA: sensor histidine kinase [Gaiellaceae bacterium]
MDIEAAMRRPFSGAAALVVPALGALLAASAITGTFLLQHHEGVDRAHELRIVDLRSKFAALQNMPWDARPLSGDLLAAQQELDHALARNGLRSLVPQVDMNVAVLYAIDAYVVAGDTGGASKLARQARRLSRPVVIRLDAAAQNATRDARRADLESTVGSTAAIALLFAGFGLVSVRLRRAHNDERAHRTELERAQAERKVLLARTVEGADEERRRIAADLHDGPVQRLTATAFALDLLANRIARGELESAEEDLRDVREALAAQMHSLRRLMTELRPPVLDEGGVAAAIANRAVQTLGLDATYAVHDRTRAARLVPEVETAVYRVAGEALMNVMKHARASRVDIFLDRRGNRLHLVVVDDGVGFDGTAAPDRTEHLGLEAMRERIESVGGTFRIVSAPGLGTRVEASVEWRARVEEHRAVA